MKTSKFLILTVFIGICLALLIYWREHDVRSLVSLFRVLLWQIAIWSPWTLGFILLKSVNGLTPTPRYRILLLVVGSLIWISLHFAWFFIFSSYYSPYLHLPGTRFGVFRYFFVFWTVMDLGLLLFVLDKLRPVAGEKPTLLFELTRGSSKYFCDPTQIYLLASENYYTRLHTSEGVFVMRKSLKSYEELLPAETFLRIHRSAIVNVNQVAELARDGHGLEVVMKDGTRRRVSRNLAGEINAYFRNRAL
jgi:hypothetical protein